MLIFSPRTRKKKKTKIKISRLQERIGFTPSRYRLQSVTISQIHHIHPHFPYDQFPLLTSHQFHHSFSNSQSLYTLKPHRINFLLAQTLNPSEPTATAMAGQSDPQLSLFSAEEVSLSLSLSVYALTFFT